MKYVLVGEKVAIGFGAHWIKTLVSMATDSSHRTIMGENIFSCFLSCFDPILFISHAMRLNGQVRQLSMELAAHEPF